MKAQIVQMVDKDMISTWVEVENLIAAMEVRGFKPTGQVGRSPLRGCLVGKPKFTGIYGPMYGQDEAGNDAVRYEEPAAYDILSR